MKKFFRGNSLNIFTLAIMAAIVCLVLSLNSCKSSSIDPLNESPGISNYEWAKDGKGGGSGQSLATDNEGNIYVVGFMGQKIVLDSITLISNKMSDNFLAKYSSRGKILWGSMGGYSSIAIDDEQNIYLGGDFRSGTKVFNGILLNQDANLIKLDRGGNIIWTKKFTASAYKMYLDLSGNIYVFANSLYKVSALGNILYTISLDSNNLWFRDLTVSRNGEIYITGRILRGGVLFGNIFLNTTSNKDLFIAKFDASGKCEWAKNYGLGINKNDSGGADIDVDNNGNVYVLGYFEIDYNIEGFQFTTGETNSFFIVSYSGEGKLRWIKNLIASLTTNGAMKIDKTGCIYVAGGYYSTIDIKPISFKSSGKSLFVAKTDPDGNGLWIENSEGILPPMLQDMCIDNSGNIFITGQFQSGITFGFTSLSDSGGGFFLAKLKAH